MAMADVFEDNKGEEKENGSILSKDIFPTYIYFQSHISKACNLMMMLL